MHFNSLLILMLSHALAVHSVPLSHRDAPGDPGQPVCPDTGMHIVVGSGANTPQYDGYGRLNTTIQGILDRVHGSSNYSIPFVKTSDPNIINDVVAVGAQLMTSYIEWFSAGCPDTPIFLVGYSLGGMVTMDTLCGTEYNDSSFGDPLDSNSTQNIIGITVYGEETYVPDMPYNKGTCINGTGLWERQDTTGCTPYAGMLKSYCDINDPYCCVGSPAPDVAIHYTYPTTYDADVADFAHKRYKKWKKTLKLRGDGKGNGKGTGRV